MARYERPMFINYHRLPLFRCLVLNELECVKFSLSPDGEVLLRQDFTVEREKNREREREWIDRKE